MGGGEVVRGLLEIMLCVVAWQAGRPDVAVSPTRRPSPPSAPELTRERIAAIWDAGEAALFAQARVCERAANRRRR